MAQEGDLNFHLLGVNTQCIIECTLATYVILLSNAIPINLIKFKKIHQTQMSLPLVILQ